ncbi:MAG: 30S ribosomal protein S12 methylthiotransferase RimO [Clostridiales bacterium]|nr:30S ribosomal protein S12 methylthiotransferase RimO [Clostridiales bacterium]
MKLWIETLGCPKNFNDSEGIAGIWEKDGLELAQTPEESDVILVNTCGFINDAKRESIDKIFEMSHISEDKILIVSGCLSQRYGQELFEEMPEVDIFLGVNEYERLPEIVESYKEGQRRQFYSCQPNEFAEFSARKIEENPYSKTLRIAEGCNNCCAYCVIPQIRGRYRSRPVEKILEEAELLAAKGCKELIIIAQDVTGYGLDLYGGLELPRLLRELCRIEGIRWIRLMYCYEDKITDELIDVMAEEKKICSYIDIPLQHCHDRVLGSMNRHSTNRSIRETISKLRDAIPDIHIRTTLITGFPGEREDEFEALVDFVEDIKFERLGVFAYSREEGTLAGKMTGQIDEDIKLQRADSIMRRQLEISRKINLGKVGKTMEVMVEGMDDKGAYTGRTQYDAPEIDETVIFDSQRPLEPGDIVNVVITDGFDYDLVGKMEE